MLISLKVKDEEFKPPSQVCFPLPRDWQESGRGGLIAKERDDTGFHLPCMSEYDQM